MKPGAIARDAMKPPAAAAWFQRMYLSFILSAAGSDGLNQPPDMQLRVLSSSIVNVLTVFRSKAGRTCDTRNTAEAVNT